MADILESTPMQAVALNVNCQVGNLVRIDQAGRCWVDYPGNDETPIEASVTVTAAARLAEALPEDPVLLVFRDGRPDAPIVVDMICSRIECPGSPDSKPAPPNWPVPMRDDGEKVVIDGSQELTLRCGRASITLKRNGKIVLKGDYVLSYSRGTNRIKGGSVQIN